MMKWHPTFLSIVWIAGLWPMIQGHLCVSIVYLFKKLSKYYPPKIGSFAKLFSELNAYWLLICFKSFFFKYVCKLIFSNTLVTYPIISNSGNIFFFIQKNVKTKWPHVNSVWKQNSAIPSIHIWFRLNYKCERFIRF